MSDRPAHIPARPRTPRHLPQNVNRYAEHSAPASSASVVHVSITDGAACRQKDRSTSRVTSTFSRAKVVEVSQ